MDHIGRTNDRDLRTHAWNIRGEERTGRDISTQIFYHRGGGSATKRTGISRSAFYKYKDAVRPFTDMMQGRIVTIQIMLKDEPGVLSSVLNVFADLGGNILTINQGIPTSGCAAVSMGVETSGLRVPMEELISAVGGQKGVIRCEILAG